MADPWSSPGIAWAMLKMLGREDAPFLLRARAFPELWRWGLSFLANCREARWRANTEAVLRLALYSRDALDALAMTTGIAHDRCDRGSLRVYRDPAALAHDLDLAAMYGKLGLPAQKLDPGEVAAIEPALEPIREQLAGGIFYAGDRSGDCHEFTRSLADILAGMGARFRFGANVVGWRMRSRSIDAAVTAEGEVDGDVFVLACASDSVPLAALLGVRLPIFPVKGYSVSLPVGSWNNAPSLPIIDHHRKIAVARLGPTLRLAGSAEFAGNDITPNPRRGQLLIRSFQALFPDRGGAIEGEHWQGLRPMTPDGRPVLGRCGADNLYVNTGHGALGWTLGCGTGLILSALVSGRLPEIPVEDFAPERI
jgi:D-amino-acid dehydrogenase